MQDSEPDIPDASGVFQKWFGGLLLPAMLLTYGIWVLLPPHHSREVNSRAQMLWWYLLLTTWGTIAICTATSCFCYYFLGGMTDRIWIKRVFTTSTTILLVSVTILMILLILDGVLGYAHHRGY